MGRFCLLLLSIFASLGLILLLGNCDAGVGVPPDKPLVGCVVFVLNDSTVGPSGIYRMNLDGSGMKPLAVDGDTIEFPGQWGNRYVLGETTTPSALLHPRWSPDGSRIVCELMWAFEGFVIMVMDSDGKNKHVLWEVSSAAQVPQWSPEGERILFLRSGYLGAVFAIGIVDSDGKNDRDLPIESPVVFEGDSIWFSPGNDYQWGKTGDLIYARGSVNMIPPDEYLVGSNPSNEVFALDSRDGQILSRITRNDVDEGSFRLSHDGQIIAYQRGQYGRPTTLYFLIPEGNLITKIEIGKYVDFWWNWSQGGRFLVFSGDMNADIFNNEEFQLFLLDPAQASSLQITSFKASQPDLLLVR